MSKPGLFQFLNIETSSNCNRRCPTCIRNSYPNRDKAASRFKQKYLPRDIIHNILIQSNELGFNGDVCLSFYNEPLMDFRIDELAEMARSFPGFRSVYFHSNGDYLTETFAEELDGKLDRIVFSLYMDEPKKSERRDWIQSLFHKTKVDIITTGHVTSHFSPNPDLEAEIADHIRGDCVVIRDGIFIRYNGYYSMCCEDTFGEFRLGKFPDISIEDYWYGGKRTSIVSDLGNAGWRSHYSYCSICPKS